MKNWKLSKKITLGVFLIVAFGMTMLYVTANRTMKGMMQESERNHMDSMLAAQTSLIEEYVTRQENLLTAYSKTPVVRELLKDADNAEKIEEAQLYTEYYYEGLENWEGIYIGEWNTHCIVHNNPDIVGVTLREGESLKALQDAMTSGQGLYDAGIIVSPASKKLILSMYCPVYDTDGFTILGYVGGGPYVEDLENLLCELRREEDTAGYYMLNAETETYIFADDKDLIATEIQDEMLLNIIDKVKSGNSDGEIEYKDKEGSQIANYKYIEEHGWVVVSFDSEEHETATQIQAICNETRNNISEVQNCFDQVIAFLQNDVHMQFSQFANETEDYYNSIKEIQGIISDISESSEMFADIVKRIETQIREVSDAPEDQSISSQAVLDKANQTATTTSEMIAIVDKNKEHTRAISGIVGRFS